MALDKNVPLVTNTIAADLIAINANWEAMVSDAAYNATTWDAVTDVAPSKNAVRDKIATMDAAIAANTAKNTNVPTVLSVGTVNTNTVSITSDGSADDVTLPAATVSTAGMLTTAKWAEIVANTAKVTNATHTGEVTGATALTIADDAVTYAKMQNVSATDKLLGRATAGAGNVEEIACTAFGRSLIDDANAATALGTLGLAATAAEINTACDGVLATAIEINTACDGILATAAEINTACDGATAKNSHTHDQAGIDNAAVGQGELKTATHEQSSTSTSWEAKVLTYADYGFNCRVKSAAAGVGYFKRSDDTNPSGPLSTSYVGESVFLKGSASFAAYVIQRYVTASGEVFWVWLLRDKITKQITDAEACSDHCSFGYKDPSDREHPFNNYNPDKHEIILYNPTKEELERIYAIENGRGILQTVLEDFEVDEKSQAIWPDIPVTVKIKNHDWFDRYISKEPVDIIKKVIPKVGYIKCLKMRKKA